MRKLFKDAYGWLFHKHMWIAKKNSTFYAGYRPGLKYDIHVYLHTERCARCGQERTVEI